MKRLSIQAIDFTPNMEPLKALLEPEKCHNFDYNATYRLIDGTLVYAYWHGTTHLYLNLSTDLKTWNYDLDEDAYNEISRDEALRLIFPVQVSWPLIE
ncbi:MAG: hypothetical protein HGB19_08435 [Chlorobiales bacterium]|nr:hypothetical protein [Chlorobiales bacterium]